MSGKKKIVLAYSGGLDTSIIIHWLKENYGAEVVAVCVDVGQGKELKDLKQRAIKSGALKAYIIDAKKEFALDYIMPCVIAGAVYENKYYLATSIARPLIAKKVVEVAKKENAYALCHGATGKGNDQVRFELTFKSLAPNMKIIAPWREWDLKSRTDEIKYAQKNGIKITVSKEKPYSTDKNLWHISYEGGILEDPYNPPDEDMFEMTVSPLKAPDKPEVIEVEIKNGLLYKLNGKTLGIVEFIDKLNAAGGRHGIGRTDIVENRLVGMKSRGVYESPAAAIINTVYREIEHLVLDRDTYRMKQYLAIKYSELVYNGLWFTSLKNSLDAFFNASKNKMTGAVKLELYKGGCAILGRKSPYSLYWEELATFEEDSLYNQKDAEGFINLFGLPIKIEALKGLNKK